ncbi:MAG: acetoacetyl-CoA reductase [Glaciimonas sp.]|nr:acetoacetyl-CoA reductase [Glaciimonas sp.]
MSRIAVVTGGTGGIGTATCQALCRQGRRVVATYHAGNHAGAAAWQQAMQAQSFEVAVYPVDISGFVSCQELIGRVTADIGAVDILVNNAGMTRDSTLKKMSVENWLAVINTDLNGVFNMTRQVFDGMLMRGWGRVVNISSVNGQKGQFGQANYSAAKAGVHGFTMAAAQEGARKGVTVNTISPGYIGTEMTLAVAEEVRQQIIAKIPVGHMGTPDDIARAVAFLCDDAAGFITGADFSINGGQHMG